MSQTHFIQLTIEENKCIYKLTLLLYTTLLTARIPLNSNFSK